MKEMISRILRSSYEKFLSPTLTDPDSRRHEFILNVLLTGLVTLGCISLVSILIHMTASHVLHDSGSLVLHVSFMAILLGLVMLSRRGYYLPVATILVSAIGLIGTYFMVTWSFALPMVPVTYILTIVLTGVLFRARTTLWISTALAVLILAVGYLQTQGHWHPNTSWLSHELDMIDAVGAAIMFCIIGIVTWLANREIDHSLARARTSEKALLRERDSLEARVVERTRELKSAQLIRVMELQRLSEYGRMGMSLLHDVANPLTAASLNIEQLQHSHEPSLVKQIRSSVHHIERYVEAARKQLQAEGGAQNFNVIDEINQIITIVQHRMKKQGIQVQARRKGAITLYGDPVKFSQLTANLISNAIESYDGVTRRDRIIIVLAKSEDNGITLIVRDNGKGIAKEDLQQVFDPFFSTKSHTKHNMGIGLSMVKRTVEQDFNGSIQIASNRKTGTTFTIRLHNYREEPHASKHNSKRTGVHSSPSEYTRRP